MTESKRVYLRFVLVRKTDLIAIGELDHQLGHLFVDAVLQLLDKSGTPVSFCDCDW